LKKTPPCPADKDTAKALSVPAGSPVLVTRTRYHAADSQIIAYTETATTAGHWRTRAFTISGN
jgi:DNA-binding GntR family transcriptional regulator